MPCFFLSDLEDVCFKYFVLLHFLLVQINHHLDPTIPPVYYPDVYLQLNMFRASSRPSSGATTTAVAASGLPLELGDRSVVGRGRLPDHDQQQCYHHAPKVKPEAATAVVAPDDGHEDARNMLSCI